MSKDARRKQAAQSYLEREVVGGIYCLVNTVTGWRSEPRVTTEIRKEKSKLEFAQQSGLCFARELDAQWAQYGPGAFGLEVLESITRKPDVSDADYKDELKLLLKMYNENR